jgi:predicted alpha/beta hydrolase
MNADAGATATSALRWIRTGAGDGYEVPLAVLERAGARACVLVLPALGTRAGYYERFATALHAHGFAVGILEYRGHGESALRAARTRNWGFRECLERDIPAAIAELRHRFPQAALCLCGHSLGGHFSAMLSALQPQAMDAIALVACGTPYAGAYTGRTRELVQKLIRWMPWLHALFGYFPGERLRFGGREARKLMRDWRVLAQTNRYHARGIERDFEAGIAQWRGPLLVLRMAEDPFAPAAAVAAIGEKFRAAAVRKDVLDSAALGTRADHYGWCREPQAAVARIASWLDGIHKGE